MIPSGDQVVAFASGGDPGRAEEYAAVISAMARAYTRGNGFIGNMPNEELEAVIVTATARLMANPTGDRQITAGPFARSPGSFTGWNLAELAVLNRYRKRAL